MEPVLQQLAKCGLRADGRTIRRRYQRLLRKYKELRDHNNKTGMVGLLFLELVIRSIALAIIHLSVVEGRDRRTFKFYDAFEEEFSKMPTVEIDTVVDESGK